MERPAARDKMRRAPRWLQTPSYSDPECPGDRAGRRGSDSRASHASRIAATQGGRESGNSDESCGGAVTTPLPNIVVLGTVLAAQLAASNAYAACIVTSEVAARGRFVRCEDAKFYLEASGAYERYERALEEILARTEPGRRDAVREQLGIDPDATSLLRAGVEARVAVVLVEWRASIAPWRPDSSDAVELVAEPQELYETARYWWNGSIESC